MAFVAALLIGLVAGLRTFTAPAAISWAAYLGWLPLQNSPFAFMGHAFTLWIFTLLALLELVGDKLPSTPSRKVPMQFGARIVSGAFTGTAIGFAGSGLGMVCLISGILGAVLGTFGGHEVRRRLALAFGRDMPAALIEDVVALGGAFLIARFLL
ncbi:membrane protein [Labrys miyagiensis]